VVHIACWVIYLTSELGNFISFFLVNFRNTIHDIQIMYFLAKVFLQFQYIYIFFLTSRSFQNKLFFALQYPFNLKDESILVMSSMRYGTGIRSLDRNTFLWLYPCPWPTYNALTAALIVITLSWICLVHEFGKSLPITWNRQLHDLGVT
jgi:hypothetical protein